MYGLVDKSEVILVIPVGNHNWPNIDIIVSCLRTMDDDRSDSAARVLSAVVAYRISVIEPMHLSNGENIL